MLPPDLAAARHEAARHRLHAHSHPARGPELAVIVITTDSTAPVDLDGPTVVGVLRQMWTTSRTRPHELARALQRGQPGQLTRKVRRWQTWGPAGRHRLARLGTADTVRDAILDLLRHPGPAATARKAR